MTEYILACKCGDTPAYAKDAYSIIFPDTPVPEIVVGDDEVQALADSLHPKTEIEQYVRAVGRNKEKYALFLRADENGDIEMAYNLLTGRKIQ